MKKLLKLPVFKNENEEIAFWDAIDLSDYYEPKDAKPISFPNLKPSTRSISLRLPEDLIDGVKERANEIDVPYQSLMKQFLAEKLSELRQKRVSRITA